MDSSKEQAAVALRTELKALIVAAGGPSYGDIVDYAKQWIDERYGPKSGTAHSQPAGPHQRKPRPKAVGRSTIADNLAGNRPSMRWPVVYFIVLGCAAAAAAHGITVDERFHVQRWMKLWEAQATDDGLSPILEPGHPSSVVSRPVGSRLVSTRSAIMSLVA